MEDLINSGVDPFEDILEEISPGDDALRNWRSQRLIIWLLLLNQVLKNSCWQNSLRASY